MKIVHFAIFVEKKAIAILCKVDELCCTLVLYLDCVSEVAIRASVAGLAGALNVRRLLQLPFVHWCGLSVLQPL